MKRIILSAVFIFLFFSCSSSGGGKTDGMEADSDTAAAADTVLSDKDGITIDTDIVKPDTEAVIIDTDTIAGENDITAAEADVLSADTDAAVLPDTDTECLDGAAESKDCANLGKQIRECKNGLWGQYSDCINITDTITNIAAKSDCAALDWLDRGSAPASYPKGMGLVFAGAVCHKDRSDVLLVSGAKGTDAKKDALLWYDTIFTGLSMPNDVAGIDTLRHAYTLLIGLGMRESSGEHCCGRDTSASNTTAETAEAGLFQTSYNSHTINKELDTLYAYWKNVKSSTPEKCLLEVFQKGVTCNAANWENFGTGEGVIFQQMEKECPAFAAEYAAVMIRVSGGSQGHYGPLRTKAAEVKTECDAMFKEIEQVIEEQPAFCEFLLNY